METSSSVVIVFNHGNIWYMAEPCTGWSNSQNTAEHRQPSSGFWEGTARGMQVGLSNPWVTTAGFHMQVMHDLTSDMGRNVPNTMEPVALGGS